MTLVKGPNGLVVDVFPSVASGLIGGGHVEAVDDSDAESGGVVHRNDVTNPDQDEHTGAEVEDSDDDSDESSTEATARPGGNASKQAWYDYALAQGFAEEQLVGLKQNEIRALFDE